MESMSQGELFGKPESSQKKQVPQGERLRSRYAEHKALGLCVYCSRKHVPGRVRCRVCIDRMNAEQNARRKSEGPGGEQAREQNRAYLKRRAKKRKDNGSCVRCGRQPAEVGYSKCKSCIDRTNADQRVRSRIFQAKFPEEACKRNTAQSRKRSTRRKADGLLFPMQPASRQRESLVRATQKTCQRGRTATQGEVGRCWPLLELRE